MSRTVVTFVLVHLLFLDVILTASINGMAQPGYVYLKLTQDDVIPETQLTRLINDQARDIRFIGDLIIGDRLSGETVFWRSLEINNPTDEVYSRVVTLTVDNGVIHYLGVLNDQGSYAVACDEPYSLGSSRSNFKIRVTPNSKSTVTIVVAAH